MSNFYKNNILYLLFFIYTIQSGSLCSTIQQEYDRRDAFASRVRITAIHIDKESVGSLQYARGWFEPGLPWAIAGLHSVRKPKCSQWVKCFNTSYYPVISYTGDKYLFLRVSPKDKEYAEDFFVYCSSQDYDHIMLVKIANVEKGRSYNYVDSHSFIRDSKTQIGVVPDDQGYSAETPYHCTLHVKYENMKLVCTVKQAETCF